MDAEQANFYFRQYVSKIYELQVEGFLVGYSIKFNSHVGCPVGKILFQLWIHCSEKHCVRKVFPARL